MSDTPRTDAKEKETENYGCRQSLERHAHYGWKFARTLETKLTAAEARVRELEEALKRADTFIQNGIEYGFVTLPDKSDPAHETLQIIAKALEKK